MTPIPWWRVDDYLFVKLVGDLLARLGFLDIEHQGDGPDGGIDLFATEMLPFAVGGRSPFRWAVQCKFSAEPKTAAVNDGEIRDVEGILRSERYTTQAPRGYMLVTNRRIVQNVIERLRGIDRNSSFRTARIDQAALEALLADHPETVNRYFAEPTGLAIDLGSQLVIATPSEQGLNASRPVVNVRIRQLGATNRETRVDAVIDTGAQISVIPRSAAERLALRANGVVRIRTFDSDLGAIPTYFVDLAIENSEFEPIEVVALDRTVGLLGWDVLSRYSILLQQDGTVRLYR